MKTLAAAGERGLLALVAASRCVVKRRTDHN
jgi:hypothetical protein